MHILLNGYVPYTYDLYVCLICISHVHSLCVCRMYLQMKSTPHPLQGNPGGDSRLLAVGGTFEEIHPPPWDL